MQVSPQTLFHYVISNVTGHINMISKLIIKYLLFLKWYNLTCFLSWRCSPQCVTCSLEMHRSGAPHRASSDDVDRFFTLRVDLPEEGRSTWRVWLNRYLRGHRIMLCDRSAALWRARRSLKPSDMGRVVVMEIEHSYGVWLVLTTRCRNLVPMTSLWDPTLSVEPYCCITCSFEFGCRSCADVS
ncbi:hypothetical protein M9H77_31191 [Catharanthus roseus]|uniref:Uncharacterized protein n=1 Tax=Catharanthus roseus TaxID=4058 RepID=A0ACC0A078_CATRO|nr:hypothetical protein M9H77_31191 [Catharanthus roseus]